MRRGWTVAGLALVATACARERVEEPTAAVRPDVVQGALADWTADTVVIDEGEPGGPLTELAVDERTQWVGAEGERLDRNALDEGLPVRVFYDSTGGREALASRVEVVGPPPESPAGVFSQPPRPGAPPRPEAPVEPDAPGDEPLEPNGRGVGEPDQRPDVVPEPLP